MTEQEKWRMTVQYMQQVRANYHLLRADGSGRNVRRLQRLNVLTRWQEVIRRAYMKLKDRKGKSSARARHDWLVARSIELMVFEQTAWEEVRQNLSGGRSHTQQYALRFQEAAIQAIKEEAEVCGLFEGRSIRRNG